MRPISFLGQYRVFIILLLFFMSCAHYVYVDSNLTTPRDRFPSNAVTSTDKYRNSINSIKNIALKAPDDCSERSASSSDRYANPRKDVVRSRCGVEMSIIERGLIKSGYNVFSWEMLESMVSASNKSYLECAKELGADVLFTINALEEIVAEDSDDLVERHYYYSDRTGKKGKPRGLDIYHRKYIGNLLKPIDSKLVGVSLGATIDVTAIDIKTGRTIWFYKSSAYDLKQNDIKYSAAFVGKKRRWRMFQLNNMPFRPTNIASKDTKKINKTRDVEKYFEKYVNQVVKDFIEAFRSGK